MNKFLLALLFPFIFYSFSNAEDIRDFEIEGISIGNNFTKTLSKSQIKNNVLPYFENTRKYYIVGMNNNLENYDQVEVYLKTNDNNYSVRAVIGGIFISDLDQCMKKKSEIVSDIDQIFTTVKKRSGKKKHEADPSGNSMHYIDQYGLNFPNHIRVECTQFSKEMINSGMAQNSLNVVVMTEEINDWVYSGYK